MPKHQCVATWLSKLQRAAFKARHLWLYCRWTEMEPKELLVLKDDRSKTDAEEMLDRFVADKGTGLTNSVKWNVVNAVKSFFKHNYRSLEKASGQIALEKVKPYRTPTKAKLRKLWKAATNPRDRVIISMLCSTGIAKGTLIALKWSHLEDGWEDTEIPHISIPDILLKGHGRGKWKGVKQETFLTPEAKQDLLAYKEWMERVKGVKFSKDSHIFMTISKPYGPLTYSNLGNTIILISKNAGVPFSPHDARRYVQTALEESGMPVNWAKKIRGRKLRGEEAPYSRPAIEQLRVTFKKAIPRLQFLSEAPAISREEVRKAVALSLPDETLKPVAKRYGITVKQLRLIIAKLKPEENIEEGLKRLKFEPRKFKIRTKANGGGRDCQRIVSEEELPTCLAQGWRFVATLSNGRVVIESPP